MSGLVAAFDKGGTGGNFTRGGRPAWSTALRSGRSPYRFAGSNPAPRITLHKAGENPEVVLPAAGAGFALMAMLGAAMMARRPEQD